MSEGLALSLGSMTTWFADAEIPFMVAGSFASTFHGHPRATQDIDVVIDPTRESLLRFVDLIPQDVAYVDRSSALEALARREMFNVIDMRTGWKTDLIIRKNRPFSRAEFDRRLAVEWMGIPIFVATAEDVVLSKLEWARISGGSERQMRDVAGVVEATEATLDRAYIERWVDDLGVRETWERARVPDLG